VPKARAITYVWHRLEPARGGGTTRAHHAVVGVGDQVPSGSLMLRVAPLGASRSICVLAES